MHEDSMSDVRMRKDSQTGDKGLYWHFKFFLTVELNNRRNGGGMYSC